MNLSMLEQYIETGNFQDLELLLNRNPELVNLKTSHDISPLLLACYYNKPQIVQSILKYIKTITIHEASAVGLRDHVQMMIDYKKDVVHEISSNGISVLGIATHFKKEDIVKILLTHKADPNIPSQSGYRIFPLHMALLANNATISRLLIDFGANVNTPHQSGLTPLHIAVQNGDIEIIIRLLEEGADISALTPEQETAADIAATKGFYEIAEILKMD